jgi:hypothetical protein
MMKMHGQTTLKSSQVLGQQLQIIFVEENIGGEERRRYLGFHNFIYFVS